LIDRQERTSQEFSNPGAAASKEAPILWRACFPPDIPSNLFSWSNHNGTITNSDFELAGTIIEHEAIVQIGTSTSAPTTPQMKFSCKSFRYNHRCAYLLRLYNPSTNATIVVVPKSSTSRAR
jgi:hypothetical protein